MKGKVQPIDLTKLDPKQEVFAKDLRMFYTSTGGWDGGENDSYDDKDKIVAGSERLALVDTERMMSIIFDEEKSGRIAEIEDSYGLYFRVGATKGYPEGVDGIGRLRDITDADYKKAKDTNSQANGKYADATSLYERIATCAKTARQTNNTRSTSDSETTITISDIQKVAERVRELGMPDVEAEKAKLSKVATTKEVYEKLFQMEDK